MAEGVNKEAVMYKRILFESMEGMLKWMNRENIASVDIVGIMPFQTEEPSLYGQLRRGYEIVYRDRKRKA